MIKTLHKYLIGAFVLSCLPATQATAQNQDIVGGWIHTGAQSELVIRSTIQQRSYSMPGDFSLGGSMGVGSPTNMVISTTPTPTMVRREMALIIQEDGDFSWVTEKRYAEGANCETTVRQEKVGQVSSEGGSATFTINRGFDRSERCDGRNGETDRSGQSETYRVTRSGPNLRISDGTVTWIFKRHSQ